MMIITSQILLFASSSLFILFLHFFPTCDANCSPSACGTIRNISSPFRLKGDPKNCGDRRFEFVCENNVTSLYLNSHKFYVKEINYSHNDAYDNSTIRLVDASINNHTCSVPTSSLSDYNFSRNNHRPYPYLTQIDSSNLINIMSCPDPLKDSSLFTDITHCQTFNSNSSHPRFTYIKVGRMNASAVRQTCRVELMVMTSWGFKDSNNVSLEEIHHSLLYGFELTVCPWCRSSTVWDEFRPFLIGIIPFLLIILGLLCAAVSAPIMTIIGFSFVLGIICYYIGPTLYYTIKYGLPSKTAAYYISLTAIIVAPRFIIFPFAIWLLIYKFRRRHLSMFDSIESFLQSDNKIKPIRYSYSDIKKMTRGFQDKLGEGGYGSVYKGKLRSGHNVAVKLLGKSGANGQDFINEIATIGRIHHINVVKLVGYCAQGSKRALVLDFMSNGSLEKYLCNREKMNFLNWNTKFEIVVGVAQGIEYLHRGCSIQILHFDIKPHNILLDDKFIPKISDFGLAKFYSTDKNTVTMTTARGTIGYVAPELISRSIGAVSYKADVYSFGMLLMEMLGLKRDLIGNNDDSNLCFPYWIYDYFKQGKNIEIEKSNDDNDNNENDGTKRLIRKLTIVALWCIQMSPDDRPSMNQVLAMLEGNVERLQVPDYPSQSTQIIINVDQSEITCWSDSVTMHAA